MANINELIGAYGSYHYSGTAEITGIFGTAIVQEDSTVFSTLVETIGDVTADYLTAGNYSGKSLKKGAVVTTGGHISNVALTSGSVILYNALS